jgi:PAS domain S-box-containing protein
LLETELFALLEHTADAAYSVTAEGEIRSWNRAAERLFGHPAAAAIGRNVDDLLQARDALGTDALSGGMEAATPRWDGAEGGIPHFDREVRTRGGEHVWVNVSTIVFDNRRTGARLFVRLARDVTGRRRREHLVAGMTDLARQLVSLSGGEPHLAPVELLSDQERRILTLFAQGTSSAAVSRELRISPQTLRNHLHHINRKLRTHSRLEAVTHAQRRGLIE